MDLKHANGEQMTVEKLISFVPCEKKEFFLRIENPTKLSSTGTTQIFSKKGRVAWKIALFSAWDWRLLFLAGEEELTSKNLIVPSKFQRDKLLLRFSIISIQSPRIPSISNYASEASYEHFNSVFILSVSLILYEILLKAKSKHCPSFFLIP